MKLIKKGLLWVFVIFLLVFSMNANSVGCTPSTKLSIIFVDSGQTYLVDPSKVPTTTVQFDVTVTDISEIQPLYGFGLYIRWAGPILDVISIVEGPFLAAGGTTFFTPKWFNEPDSAGFTDYLLVVNTLLAAPEGVSGSGVLCTITFRVDATGETAFQIYDDDLYDQYDKLIAHDSEDGYFANESWADKGYPGDVDGDHDVDLADLMIMARAMGTDPSYPSGTGWHEWNSAADLNSDDKVDIFDLVVVGVNYGQPRYP